VNWLSGFSGSPKSIDASAPFYIGAGPGKACSKSAVVSGSVKHLLTMRITKQHHQPKALHSLAVTPWLNRGLILLERASAFRSEVSQAVSNLSNKKSRKTAGMERRYTTQRHAQGGDEPNETLWMTDERVVGGTPGICEWMQNDNLTVSNKGRTTK
jgi:hypothetical protein